MYNSKPLLSTLRMWYPAAHSDSYFYRLLRSLHAFPTKVTLCLQMSYMYSEL